MVDRTQSYTQQQTQQREEIAVIANTIEKQEQKYADILPSTVSWADFKNAFLIAVQMNHRLLDADRQSLWLSLQLAASDGLKPDGRESALVIFGDDQEDEEGNPIASQAKGKKKVVYMPMVAGLIKLVRNTGNVANIRAKLVYRGERVVICDEDGKETYKHVREIDANSEIDDSPEKIIGAYAVINYKDGFWEMEAMTARQIARVRAVSRSKKGPWLAWADEMAKKTVLRRLIKRLEKSAELQRLDAAIEHDETMATTIEGERPTEVMGEIEQAHEIRQEFTGQKQAEPVKTAAAREPAAKASEKPIQTQQTNQPDPGAGHSRQAETTKSSAGEYASRGAPSVSGAGSGQTDTGNPVSTNTQAEPAEIWATDEFGEPLDRPEPMTAIEFANWFAAQLFMTKSPDALREHNADAIGDAGGANDEARQVITDAIQRHQKRAEESAQKASAPGPENPPQTAQQPAQVVPKRRAIPIQKTAKGATHWPNYVAIAKQEIPNLESAAEADEWEALNAPTYRASGAGQIAINNALTDRRKALAGGGQANPPSDTNAPSIPTDPAEVLNLVTIQMKTMNTLEDVTAWSAGAAVQDMMNGLRQRNKDMWSECIGVIDATRLNLSPPS